MNNTGVMIISTWSYSNLTVIVINEHKRGVIECLRRINEQTTRRDAITTSSWWDRHSVSTVVNLLYSERRALDSCCHQSDPGLCMRRAEHLLRGRIYYTLY